MSEAMGTEPQYQIKTRKPYLQLIADGVKTVDVRIATPEMRMLTAGQEVAFTAGDSSVRARVVRVAEYGSFDEMLNHEEPRAIGGALGGSRSQLLAVIRSIYPAEMERLGVLALQIETI